MNIILSKTIPALKTNLRHVPIVMCFDDNYCPGGAALLSSICHNSSSENFYDVILFENDISDSNKRKLQDIIKTHKNITLRFFSFDNLENIRFAPEVAYFSVAAYARLYIPKVMPDYSKVIYIDSDMILKADPALLLNFDLGDSVIGAVIDFPLQNSNYSLNFEYKGNSIVASDYIKNILGIVNLENYFNSGLLILDIKKLNYGIANSLLEEIEKDHYFFPDQDILNKICMGKVYYLPLEWNVFSQELLFPIKDKKTELEYRKARTSPKIVHFAGSKKPWKYPNVNYVKDYKSFISGTDWHKDVQKAHQNIKLQFKNALSKSYFYFLPSWSRRSYIGRIIYRSLRSILQKKT